MAPVNLALVLALCVGAGAVIAFAVQSVIEGYFWEALPGGAFLTWVFREIFKDR